jgi:hypothetical protein
MKKVMSAAALVLGVSTMVGAQDVVTAVHGTIKKIDAGAKTVVVATDKGAEEVIHFTDKTVVHGSVVGAKDAFHGLKEGSEIVAHYTAKGAQKTAVEVDRLGKEGLKVLEGTVSSVGAGSKTVVLKAADGSEQAFDVSTHAVSEFGKATAKGTDKAAKVSVYYTEEGGKKIAHFFKKF